MNKVRDDLIIDVCVVPPLQETLENFHNTSGPFSMYSDLNSDKEKKELMDSIMDDPATHLIKLMDEAGIDKVMLTAEDAETTMDMIVPNISVADFAQSHPDRFLLMGAVDPHKGMKALRDLEYAVNELGIQCLCLEPWLHKINSNDKLYYPIYAKAVELAIPVWIHTSLNLEPKLSMDYGRPIYIDEVAGHFPELKIIAGHGGWPWVNEMMAVLWRHENVYADIAAINPEYIGTDGSGWDTLLRYGNTVLKEKILFATAWPARNFKEAVEGVKSLPLKDEVKKLWLGGNAQRIFNI